jgi:DNA mismatch repair protein MLH3
VKHLKVIGQVDNKFVACKLNRSNSVSVLLIDQHAADERIRLETIWRETFLGTCNHVWSFKSVLVKDSLEGDVESKHRISIRRFASQLSVWGFELAGLNESDEKMTLTRIPSILAHRMGQDGYVQEVMLDCIQEWDLLDVVPDFHPLSSISVDSKTTMYRRLRRCPKALIDAMNFLACRYAIMFGDPLTDEQCVDLVMKLGDCDFPFQCAHGRPSMIPIARI